MTSVKHIIYVVVGVVLLIGSAICFAILFPMYVENKFIKDNAVSICLQWGGYEQAGGEIEKFNEYRYGRATLNIVDACEVALGALDGGDKKSQVKYLLGLAFISADRFDDADALYQKMKNDNDVYGFYGLAELYRAQNKIRLEAETLDLIGKKYDNMPASLALRAAEIHYSGLNVTTDYAAARSYYERVDVKFFDQIDAGVGIRAKYQYGRLLFEGLGGTQDIEKSRMLGYKSPREMRLEKITAGQATVPKDAIVCEKFMPMNYVIQMLIPTGRLAVIPASVDLTALRPTREHCFHIPRNTVAKDVKLYESERKNVLIAQFLDPFAGRVYYIMEVDLLLPASD